MGDMKSFQSPDKIRFSEKNVVKLCNMNNDEVQSREESLYRC